MKVRLVMNKSYTVQRFKPKYEAAQKYLDNEVLKDCTPYVPMDTGQLMRSGINATVIGSGEVVWSAPHASKCYYTDMNFQKTKHPLACSQWFEVAKGSNKEKWVKGAKAAMKG
jgi:hypothetical protein|nr:MAG TPA: Minor capsid protein [Caudoviricetes sp.]